jgi:excisionase family DNA binding protein
MTDLLTLAQAAHRLGVSRQRVHWLIQAGRLPAERLGHAWVIRAADLAVYAPRRPGRPKKSA